MLTFHTAELTWLDEYQKALMDRNPGAVERMPVYGSKARGNVREYSDINVLLIVKNDAADLKRLLRPIEYRLSATSNAVPSILAYKQEKWERRKRIGSAFFETVERDAVRVL